MLELTEIVPARHAELLFRWRQQPEIARFMYSPGPAGWADHRQWLERTARDASCRHWIITLGGQPVGAASLSEIDRRHQRAVFGMYVAEEQARLQGAGAGAEFLVLDEAFGPLGLAKVSCEVFAGNEAALRMHRRIGFQPEGILRRHARTDEGWTDVHRLSILREEWGAARPALRPALRKLLSGPVPALVS